MKYLPWLIVGGLLLHLWISRSAKANQAANAPPNPNADLGGPMFGIVDPTGGW
jgi:hypothetical protein